MAITLVLLLLPPAVGNGSTEGWEARGSLSPDSLHYILEIPEVLNKGCRDSLEGMNWLDLSEDTRIGTLKLSADELIEPAVLRLLADSKRRTLDPAAASWLYLPFFYGCSLFREGNDTFFDDHWQRLDALQRWLEQDPVAAAHVGRVPLVTTVGHENLREAVGDVVAPMAIVLTQMVVHCPAGSREAVRRGEAEPWDPVRDGSCFRRGCSPRSFCPGENDCSAFAEFEGANRCLRAFSRQHVAVPCFPDPALGAHFVGTEWLLSKQRRHDFFFQGRPNHPDRQRVAALFEGYAARHPGRESLVRVLDDPLSVQHDAEFVASYRARMVDARACLIMRGHMPWARHLWNAIAAGCVPVLISSYEGLQIPFESELPWPTFSVAVSVTDATFDDPAEAGRMMDRLFAFIERGYTCRLRSLIRHRLAFFPGHGNPLSSGDTFLQPDARFEDLLLGRIGERAMDRGRLSPPPDEPGEEGAVRNWGLDDECAEEQG